MLILSKMPQAALLAGALSLCAVAPSHAADTPATDRAGVSQVLMSQFDRPEARLTVDPVVVSGNAALAGWSQGERGGRALLFRTAHGWQIALCGGDGLKDAKVLREAGVKGAAADTLARQLAAAEARLPAAHRARFSTFDGLMRMDASGAHPPTHKH